MGKRKLLNEKINSSGNHKSKRFKADTRNPFETNSNKSIKNFIPGKTVRGKNRNISKARSDAFNKRNTTLLNEFNNKDKINHFEDKRFGENDPTLSIEQKMLKRFQEQRKRSTKSERFQIDSDDEILTHMGQSLSDDFDYKQIEKVSSDEEADSSLSHFKNVNSKTRTNNNQPKTHKEILLDIIAKSKETKIQKKHEKDEIDNNIDMLDDELDTISDLLQYRTKKENMDIKFTKELQDEYDINAKSLLDDIRVQATNRTKTDEEITKDEYEKLKKLESERIQRMKGDSTTIETVKTEMNDNNQDREFLSHINMEDISDDEYSDKIDIENSNNTSNKNNKDVDVIDDDELEEGEELEGIENEEGIESRDKRGFSEGEECDGEMESSCDEEASRAISEKEMFRKKIIEMRKSASDEMPYIIQIPNSLGDWYDLIALHVKSGQDLSDLIHRTVISNNIYINVENKGKLINFYGFVVRYYFDLIDSDIFDGDINKVDLLNNIMLSLYEISQKYPRAAKKIFGDEIILWRDRMNKNVQYKNYTPQVISKDLLLFALISSIFSVSDFSHLITLPATILMIKTLASIPIYTPLSVIQLLFGTTLLTNCIHENKKLIPEIFTILQTVLSLCLNMPDRSLLATCKDVSWISNNNNKTIGEVADKLSLTYLINYNLKISKNVRSLIIDNIYNQISSLICIYSDIPSFIEYFSCFYDLLIDADETLIPTNLIDSHHNLLKVIIDQMKNSRNSRIPVHLQPQTQFKEIISLTPQYEVGYNPVRTDHLDERKVLRRKLARERRGALRELRKDSEFLSLVRSKEKDIENEIKTKKRKEIISGLEEQQKTYKDFVKRKLKIDISPSNNLKTS